MKVNEKNILCTENTNENEFSNYKKYKNNVEIIIKN